MSREKDGTGGRRLCSLSKGLLSIQCGYYRWLILCCHFVHTATDCGHYLLDMYG